MPRIDVSDHLVHWTSGEDDEEAYGRLFDILIASRINGSNEKIKGAHHCVCFTEAPEREFHKIKTKYKPFGIQIPKPWLFSRGGRPVIYQTDNEYYSLPRELQWRHVRYEPSGTPPIDFTWEREWRINEYYLELDPENMIVLLPNDDWANSLIQEYEAHMHFEAQYEALSYGEDYVGSLTNGIPFRYAVINA